MPSRLAITGYRLAFSLLALAAILVQLADLAGKGVLNPVNYFSYFTIESNLIGAAVLLIGAATWRAARSSTWDLVRGGAVLYLTITFVVFALLLSGTDVDTAIPWVNTVLHYIMPVAVVLEWLYQPPRMKLGASQLLLWQVFPLLYLAYVLIRGSIVGWYPYPFLDPDKVGGFGGVGVYILGIFVVFFAVSWLSLMVGNKLNGNVAVASE